MTLDDYVVIQVHKSLAGDGLAPTYERVLNQLIYLRHNSAAEAVLKRMTNKDHSLDDLDMDAP